MESKEGNSIWWEVDNFKIEIKYPYKKYWTTPLIYKIDLVNYYKFIGAYMLPYLQNRPLTLRYFPQGMSGISFYKRNIKTVPDSIVTLYDYKEISQNKTIKVPVVNNLAGLLYFASKGVIEFHLWNSVYPDFDKPDWVVFDLDIDSVTNFQKVLQVSSILYEYLNDKGIQSFAKTSGGSGMHVYVPIVPEYTFEQTRDWVQQIGATLAEKFPDLISVKRKGGATHYSGKVVIDYLQNTISRTMVAPYSVRAHKNATVSTPVSWEEVKRKSFVPQDFTIQTIPKRLKNTGDLFAEILKLKQRIM